MIQKKLVLYVNLLICCTSWINVGKINLTFKKQAYLITFGWPPPVIPYSSRRVHPSTVCLRQKKWKLIHEIMCLKAWDRKKNTNVHTRSLVLWGSSMKCVSGRIGEVSWCVPALFSEVKIFSQRLLMTGVNDPLSPLHARWVWRTCGSCDSARWEDDFLLKRWIATALSSRCTAHRSSVERALLSAWRFLPNRARHQPHLLEHVLYNTFNP